MISFTQIFEALVARYWKNRQVKMESQDSQGMEFDLFDDDDDVILEKAANNFSACFPAHNLSDEFVSQNDTLARLVKGTIMGDGVMDPKEQSTTPDVMVNGSKSPIRPGRIDSPQLEEEFRRNVNVGEKSNVDGSSGNSGSKYVSAEDSSKENAGVKPTATRTKPTTTPIPSTSKNKKARTPSMELRSKNSGGKKIFNLPENSTGSDVKLSIAAIITSAVERAGSDTKPGDDGIVKNGESGFIAHDFSLEASDLHEFDKPSPPPSSNTSFINVVELTRNGVKRTIPKNDVIPFVMVEQKDDGWITPPLFVFHAAVNMLEGFLMEYRPYLRCVVEWAEEWKGVGIVGLSVDNLDLLEEWRGMVVQLDIPGHRLDTFPKDCLLVGTELTALLKDKFRFYELKWLPYSLFSRNKGLHGKVRVTYSKTYTASDTTFTGISKKGWRLVYLAGDSIFMDSLKAFTSNYGFLMGSGRIQIWGGIRKPMLPFSSRVRKNSVFSWRRPDKESNALLSALSPDLVEIGDPNMSQSTQGLARSSKIVKKGKSKLEKQKPNRPMNKRERKLAKKQKPEENDKSVRE